nr:hypothetical protein CFP56_34182 [Quercus suber]
MWIEEEGCQDSVESAWRQPVNGNLMEQVEGKLKRCQLNLSWWSRNSFGNVTKQLKEKKEKLRREEEAAIRGGTVEGVLKLKREISDLSGKEEKKWKQRFRALWLHEGDKNTRYFYSRETHKYRCNKICELRNSLGQMCTDEEEIAQILISYNQDLFTLASPCNLDQAVADIPCSVTTEMNNMFQEGSPQKIAPRDVRVAYLIDQDTKQWDGVKIDHLFLPFEAAKIKSIPMCTTNQANCIVWPRWRDGVYSVKSGYQLLCELDAQNRASGSDMTSKKVFWRRLWKMKVIDLVTLVGEQANQLELFAAIAWFIWG